MNKKILPIFVMVMALSLLGVSCNKKTTDPTTTTETKQTVKITAQNFKDILDGFIYTDPNGEKYDFSTKGTGFAAGTAIAVTGDASDTTTTPSISGIQNNFDTALKSYLASKGIDTGAITYTGTGAANNNQTAVSFKFTPTAAAGYYFDVDLVFLLEDSGSAGAIAEIEITLAPGANWNS